MHFGGLALYETPLRESLMGGVGGEELMVIWATGDLYFVTNSVYTYPISCTSLCSNVDSNASIRSFLLHIRQPETQPQVPVQARRFA